jgi:hypothetical protein
MWVLWVEVYWFSLVYWFSGFSELVPGVLKRQCPSTCSACKHDCKDTSLRTCRKRPTNLTFTKQHHDRVHH